MPNEDVTLESTTQTAPNPAPVAPAAPATPINYEDLIAKARQQEKEKLYPEIERLKGENAKLVEKNNALLLSLGEKDQVMAEAGKLIAKLEEQVKIKAEEGNASMEKDKTLAELQKENETLKADLVKKDAEFKAFIDKAEVAAYMGNKIKEVQLDPDLHELIGGATKEEVDASIVKAVAIQDKMKAKFGVSAPSPAPATAPLPKPTASAIGVDALKSVQPTDIMSMDRAAWAKMRASLGLKD